MIDWEWNWVLVGIYAFCCYVFGVLCHVVGFPAVIPMVLAAITGAGLGSYEVFEK